MMVLLRLFLPRIGQDKVNLEGNIFLLSWSWLSEAWMIPVVRTCNSSFEFCLHNPSYYNN